MNKKKIYGLVTLVVTSVISTLANAWMMDKEIETKVKEELERRNYEK